MASQDTSGHQENALDASAVRILNEIQAKEAELPMTAGEEIRIPKRFDEGLVKAGILNMFRIARFYNKLFTPIR